MEISKRQEAILVGALVLVTAVLRLIWLGTVEFKTDEANLYVMALDFVKGGGFPVRGISSSTGFPNAPMSVWLYAIPLFIWPHIYAATLFTVLLNILAVLGTYWLVRRYWGVEAALAAAFMFAVSPWMLHHSRKIWAQNLLPFFVVAWGVTAVLAFLENRPKWLIWHCLALAIAVQVHFAGAPLFLISAGLCLVYWKQLLNKNGAWKWLVAGCTLALLTLAPFILHLWREGFLTSLGASSGDNSSTGAFSLDALNWLFVLGTGQDIQGLVGATAYPSLQEKVFGFLAIPPIWNILFLLGFAWLIWQAWSAKNKLALFMLAWLIVPVLAFSYSSVSVVLHYVMPSYPVPFMAAGALVATAAKKFRWLWLPFGITLFMQAWLWVGVLTVVGSQWTPEGFGVPQSMRLSAAQEAISLLEATGAQEILLGDANGILEQGDFVTAYSALLDGYPVRVFNIEEMALFPQESAVILFDPQINDAATADYLALATDTKTIPRRDGESDLLLVALNGAQPQPKTAIDPTPIFENWASLSGIDKTDSLWRVYWHTGDAINGRYHLFTHFFTDNGERVHQADIGLFDASQWRSGDRVVNYFALESVSAESANVGMYTYPDIAPVRVFDVAGNLTADFITIQLE